MVQCSVGDLIWQVSICSCDAQYACPQSAEGGSFGKCGEAEEWRRDRLSRHLIKMSPNPIKDWQTTLVEAGSREYLISI